MPRKNASYFRSWSVKPMRKSHKPEEADSSLIATPFVTQVFYRHFDKDNQSPKIGNGFTDVRSLAKQSTSQISYVSNAAELGYQSQTDANCRSFQYDYIWNYYHQNHPTIEVLTKKQELKDLIKAILATAFPDSDLYMVGSSVTGLSSSTSDMDLCFLAQKTNQDQSLEAVKILSSVEKILIITGIVDKSQLIVARVPVLRFTCADSRFAGIQVDMNASNTISIRNTHLICHYLSLDWRVRPLVFVIKEWAKRWDINDPICSTLSSYSLVLMVIHFLQNSFYHRYPVLPSLQLLYPDEFNENRPIELLDFRKSLNPPVSVSFQSSNFKPLCSLLLGFFHYFSKTFRYDQEIISVRQGKTVPKCTVARPDLPIDYLSQWKFICIEEPYDLSNTGRSVFDERGFLRVQNAFRSSYQLLRNRRSLKILLSEP